MEAVAAPIRASILTRRDIVARGIGVILADYPRDVALVPLPSLTDERIAADVLVYDLTLVHDLGEEHLAGIVRSSGRRVVGLAPAAASPLRGMADEMGVAGCVTLDVSSRELIEAVRRAASGEVLQRTPPPSVLSRRESQVALLTCQGLSNQAIAERLFISLNTVKSHLRSAYRKMGVTTRAQAMLWCSEHDLV
jgi:DNA-binding NarL/FixJ family response regulator